MLADLGWFLIVEDPHVDPLPAAIDLFSSLAFAAFPLVLSGIAYIVYRIFRV